MHPTPIGFPQRDRSFQPNTTQRFVAHSTVSKSASRQTFFAVALAKLPAIPSAGAATAMAASPAKAKSCIRGSSINTADNSSANGTIKADASEDALSKNTSSEGNSDLARPFADAVLAAGLQNTNPLWSPAINVLNPDLEIDFHSSLETRLDPPGNVPAPLALLGAGAAFGWSRRRLNSGQPFGNLDTLRLFFPGQCPAEPVFCEAGRR
jgi:MYXO-CTERM domain-containing protein